MHKLSIPHYLDGATRHLFFTGKGGVGKTSLACATAVALAGRGMRVLLVSTDPASNLDEVLGVKLGSRPTRIDAVPGLSAMNIDPEEAARQYREKMVAPYRGVLPDAAVASITEQLSGACTVEIAAFDEFSKLLGDPVATSGYDHVCLDTAPTGHTLRLLQLPAAWADFLANNAGGTSCLGPLSGLQAQRELYAATLKALADPSRTSLILVSRLERASLAEAERTRAELSSLGISNQIIALNGVFRPNGTADPVARALESRGQAALSSMPLGLGSLPRMEIPLLPFELIGFDALRALLNGRHPVPEASDAKADIQIDVDTAPSLAATVRQIAQSRRGVVMTMGKGGVGKTTLACAIAAELARLGHKVHLTTTDPAAHVDSAIGEGMSGLTVSRIDPGRETRAYQAEVMSTAGKGLDEQGRKLLEEELRSPCTEEIAVFRAFAQKVDDAKDGFVVLDTAPTGHTLLLLDATEAYHRQVLRNQGELPESVRQLLPRLRDPGYTKIFIVALPEATPIHEAAKLQGDLARAGIKPHAWVVNQSLTPLRLTDPVLRSKRRNEEKHIREIREQHASRVVLVPWMLQEPVGPEQLSLLIEVRADIQTVNS